MFPNTTQQRIIQDNAYNAQLQNPQLKKLVEMIAQQLFGKSLSELSPFEQNMLMVAGGAFNNSFISDMMGLDNGGAQWESIHKGVISAPIAMNMVNSSGMKGIGNSYGVGSVSAGITNQLMQSLRQAAYTADGTNNTINTRGLSGNQYAQVYGQMVKREGLQPGDVLGVNLTGSAAELEKTINNLSKTGKVDTATMGRYRKLLAARKQFEQERKETNTDAEALAMVRASGKFDDDMMKDLGLQVGGNLRGVVLDKKFEERVKNATKEVAGNIKTLSELTGYKELDDLQAVADSLGMGSLTTKNNIMNVERRMREWKTIASQQGRDIREVMKEQADIVEVLAAASGGQRFVASSMVTQAQKARSIGQANYDAGTSLYTGEEVMAQETQHEFAAREHYAGVMVAEKLMRDDKSRISKGEAAGIRKKQQEFREAIKRGDTDAAHAISLELQSLAEGVNAEASTEAYKRAANAEYSGNMADIDREAALSENLVLMTAEMSAARGGKGNDAINTMREIAAEGSTAEAGMARLMNATTRAFGKDSKAMSAFGSKLEKIMALPEAERASEFKKLRQELADQGYSAEQMAHFDTMIGAASDIATKGSGDIEERQRKFNMLWTTARRTQDNPALRMTGFVTEKEDNKMMFQQLMDDVVQRSEAYTTGEGMKAVVAGLLGEGSVSAADTMNVMYERSGGKKLSEVAKENGGAVLGKVVDGKLQLGPGGMRELLSNNKELRKLLGVSDVATYMKQFGGNEQAAMEHMLSTLHSQESLGIVDGQLVTMSSESVSKFQGNMKAALNTDAAKRLRAMYGDSAVAIDKNGKAYVAGADGESRMYKFDKETAEEQMRNSDDKNDALRANILRLAAEGDKEAIGMRDSYIAELYDDLDDDNWDELDGDGEDKMDEIWEEAKKKGTVGAMRNALRSQFGTADYSVFESEQAMRDAGVIDENGKVTSGLYKGEDWTEIQKDARDSRKYFDAVEAADKATARDEKTAQDVSGIFDILDKMFNFGLKVRMS